MEWYNYNEKVICERNKKSLIYFTRQLLLSCSAGVEDMAKEIEKTAEEMLKKGTHKLVAMSMVGTDKAILPKPKITYRMIQEYVEKEYVVWVA